jgi:transmembrane sensor
VFGIFRTRGRIRREAAAWAARLGADDGGRDRGAFDRWYAADPRHAEAYDRMAAIWSASGRTSAAAQPGHEGQHHRPFRFAMAASLAAGIALLALTLLANRWLPGAQQPEGQILALASARGEIKTVRLPDGSEVVLDSGSRIDARFTGAERRLALREGRARFIVAHESRPFIVSAASNEVIATGTVFDVSLIQDRLAVLLIEGSVEVRQTAGPSSGPAHRLAAGQKLIVERRGPPVRQAAGRGETLWPSRMLEFDDTRLEEAIAMVNRYSATQLRLGDESIRELRVTGAFRAGDVAGFARSLAAAFGLKVQTQPDGGVLLVHSTTPAEP